MISVLVQTQATHDPNLRHAVSEKLSLQPQDPSIATLEQRKLEKEEDEISLADGTSVSPETAVPIPTMAPHLLTRSQRYRQLHPSQLRRLQCPSWPSVFNVNASTAATIRPMIAPSTHQLLNSQRFRQWCLLELLARRISNATVPSPRNSPNSQDIDPQRPHHDD